MTDPVIFASNEYYFEKKVVYVCTAIVALLLVSRIVKYFENFSTNFAHELYESTKQTITILTILTKAQFTKSAEGLFNSIVVSLRQYKKTPCTIWLGFCRLIYTNNPEDIQVILNSNCTLEKSTFYDFFKDTAGHGLVTGPAHKWKQNRRLITPFFSKRNFKSYFNIFNTKSTELIFKLRETSDTGDCFNLWNTISFGTYSILFDIAFGQDIKSISDEEKKQLSNIIVKLSKLYGARLVTLWLYPDIIFKVYVAIKGYSKYFNFVYSKTMQILEEIRENMNKNEQFLQDRNSKLFVENLIRLHKNGKGYTDFKDIYFETNTIIVAGSETNALTICFTLLMLSMYPDIQEKVYDEIVNILEDENKYIEYDHIEKMTYLDQCINETLRLFPVLPFYARRSTEAFKLSGGFSVPPDSHLLIPALMIHRDAQIYKNPDIWDPDRFASDQVHSRHKYSFLAFSGGQRGCIGKIYAQLEIKVIISSILKNYRLENDARPQDIKLRFDVALRSVNGYNVKLYSR